MISPEEKLSVLRARVDEALKTAVPEDTPSPLGDAMRYALLSPGKRLRPVLLLSAHELIAPADDEALRFAVALEMIHAYSLVHDDLPAMDDDVLRRGRPTCHVVYGEGMAVLAGDGLLSLAFQTMLESSHERALRAALVIARYAGTGGMVGGQGLDLAHEGALPDRALVERIQTGKTAALLTAAAEAGLVLAGADEALVNAGRRFGHALGRAFQIVDDLLDIEGDQKLLGKTTGKDQAEGKLTWPAAVGLDQARRDAARWTDEAVDALGPFGSGGDALRDMARKMLKRLS